MVSPDSIYIGLSFLFIYPCTVGLWGRKVHDLCLAVFYTEHRSFYTVLSRISWRGNAIKLTNPICRFLEVPGYCFGSIKTCHYSDQLIYRVNGRTLIFRGFESMRTCHYRDQLIYRVNSGTLIFRGFRDTVLGA